MGLRKTGMCVGCEWDRAIRRRRDLESAGAGSSRGRISLPASFGGGFTAFCFEFAGAASFARRLAGDSF
jgi:hypothetical protein